MTCREIVEFLLDYLDDELSSEQREHFEEHLAECPECVAYLSSYRTTVAVTKHALCEFVDATVDSLPEDLVRAILCTRRGTSAH